MITRVAVVGLGPAGVIATVKLASKWFQDGQLGELELIAFEMTSVIGGDAFTCPDDRMLLNMPAPSMTVHERLPLAFTAGIDVKLLDCLALAKYAPRHQYGRYLQQLLASSIAASAISGRITIDIKVGYQVTCIYPTENEIKLSTSDGAAFRFDEVIVAIGATLHPRRT